MDRPLRSRVTGPFLVVLLVVALRLDGAEALTPRYQDQKDGTVKDAETGLVWLADADCWGPLSWEDAKEEVAKLQDGMCGLTDGSKPGDWRLPTQKEWEWTVECTCNPIALRDDLGTHCYDYGTSTFHKVTPSTYWSSTESILEGSMRVMSLSRGAGAESPPSASLLAWPVRAKD